MVTMLMCIFTWGETLQLELHLIAVALFMLCDIEIIKLFNKK